jgi:hypothetical protein
MSTAQPIQHTRTHDRDYRAPNWKKHSLGQWVELMEVGDHECALMCAQTCAYYYTSSIGGQTAGPTGAQIGTNTHWNNGHKLWGSAVASARNTTYTALTPNGLDRLNPKLVQNPIGAMGTSYGVDVRAALSARSAQLGRLSRPVRSRSASTERENEREAREYRDGTGRSNCREREVRVWGGRGAHIAERGAKQNSCVFSDRHRC